MILKAFKTLGWMPLFGFARWLQSEQAVGWQWNLLGTLCSINVHNGVWSGFTRLDAEP